MTRENVYFLLGGFAFGVVVGVGVYNALAHRPDLSASALTAGEIPSPRGPMAPTQGSGSPRGPNDAGGAPMVAEVQRLKAALQQHPDDVEILGTLAHLYHQAAMWPEAASYYERATALQSGSADLWSDLGVCYRGMGEFDKALDAFERAQRAAPGHWQSLFNIAVVAGFDLGRFDRAQDALARLETIEPRPPQVEELRQKLQEQQRRGSGGGSS